MIVPASAGMTVIVGSEEVLACARMTVSVLGMESFSLRENDSDCWERGGSRLRENDKLEVVNKEIPASAGIGLGHTLPFRNQFAAGSCHSGLSFSIKLFFQDRSQVFNCFSLVMAKFTSVNCSNHTNFVQLYLLMNP